MRTALRTIARDTAYSSITTLFGDQDGYVWVPVLRGPARGLRFRLRLKGEYSESAYLLGKYDPQILKRLATLVQPGWTVWDCGTYLGFYTAFFARLVGSGGRVVGFEPDERNLHRTEQHVNLNGLTNVTFVNAAIGAPVGYTEFVPDAATNSHIPGCYVGNTRGDYLQDREEDVTVQVRCISLDQAYAELGVPGPDLVKLDIEGAESVALEYAQNLIAGASPVIVLELHNPECDEAAWTFAGATGYRLTDLQTGRPVERRADVHGTMLCTPPNRIAG